jgi:hypothetical protein
MPKGIYKRGVCKWYKGNGFIFNSTKRKYHECPECKKEAKASNKKSLNNS